MDTPAGRIDPSVHALDAPVCRGNPVGVSPPVATRHQAVSNLALLNERSYVHTDRFVRRSRDLRHPSSETNQTV